MRTVARQVVREMNGRWSVVSGWMKKGRRRAETRYLWGARSDVVIQQRLLGLCTGLLQL